jgi:hypothetical protein
MVSALNEFGFDTPQLSKELFLKENSDDFENLP